jgi:Resolvase, N terminal domain
MRIAIYARVSTKDQSCELQVRDLRAYCAARGFDLVREYVDVGQSGAKDSRPELNKLVDDARKRQFDAIVVWRFDRFARSTKHLLTALEEFRSLGIQFISYQENIDTSSALGQALFTIVSAVAQLERDLIREYDKPHNKLKLQQQRLAEFYLLAYYDEAVLHNTPYDAPGFGFREIAALVARELAVNSHPFDKVFLYSPIEKAPVSQAWPPRE